MIVFLTLFYCKGESECEERLDPTKSKEPLDSSPAGSSSPTCPRLTFGTWTVPSLGIDKAEILTATLHLIEVREGSERGEQAFDFLLQVSQTLACVYLGEGPDRSKLELELEFPKLLNFDRLQRTFTTWSSSVNSLLLLLSSSTISKL